MKKRRVRHECITNYSPSLKYSQMHERFLIRTRNIHDSKGRCSKRSYTKLQQKNKNCNDAPRLKKDAFYSLESLFDLKKILNLKDVYSLAFNYYKEKSTEKTIETLNITRSEPVVETLFLQSFSPRTNLELSEPPFDGYLKRSEEKIRNKIKTSKVFETKVSDSVEELQKNDLIHNQQNFSEIMAENDDKVQVKTEVSVVQVKRERSEEQEDKSENDIPPEENSIEAATERIEDDHKDEKDKIDDKVSDDLQDEEISEESEITYILTDEAIAELKVMDKRCIILADEIQQLKHEVVELSEKPELTEEDSYMIQDKQNVLMSKIAELNSITQKLQKTQQQLFKELESLKLDIVEKKKEVIKEERDVEPFLKFLEENDFPQVEYPENRLPRVILCGYTETGLPKIVLTDNEQIEREKCLEKLTGKLTEVLTMQEKLVEENAQLEDDKKRRYMYIESEEPEILTDEAIAELKVMNKRCIKVADEIQELKHEVVELSEKPELTEEDSYMIQDKQNVLMSKIAELNSITQKLHKTRKQMFREIESLKHFVEKKKEVLKKEERDVEPFLKFLEEAKDFSQVEYPENKLPRVIICNYAETGIPRIVLADNEQVEREKCLEKLTGKLTESLTMQEKLVKENAQLEGGKYKLEKTLLEKDTAVESLQKKVCDLQTEVRVIVKENKALKQTVDILNQRVSTPTCSHTGLSVISSSPLTPLVSPPLYVSAQLQDDRQCSQLQIAGFSKLTEGGSKTEDQYNIINLLQNKEMCSRGPAIVQPLISEGIFPAEFEDKLVSCSMSTKQLKQQLDTMENKVHNMQMELANVQRERQQLHQQRKLLKCTGPCAPCTCCPPSSTATTPGLPVTSMSKGPVPAGAPIQVTAPIGSGSFTNSTMGPSAQQQLSDLREQYARLQDDYKSKLCEVSCMRTEAEKLKQETRDANEEKERMEIKLIDAQERLKLLETEKNKYEGLKEQLIEQEQALMVAKQRFRESQDELEELRSMIQEQAAQLESYRNKYLQAQEQVEEQRRQLDLMEMDNARMNENVTLEIGRVKNQFQEKLAELAPLPDMLKQMQIKMQEAQQIRLVAERNCEDLSRELLGCKDQIQSLQNELDVLRTERHTLQNGREKNSIQVDEIEKKCSELRHENERIKNTLARSEEHRAQLQKSIDEKMHENMQLSSMLEQVREDSARQVARTKERCETMRKTMQGQITEMERQLVQCRATARAAQRDRDEIRQKMQSQINNLNEAFKHAQSRIKSLQGHVNYLKTSYSNIFLGQGETPAGVLTSVLPGDDSCDC